MTTGQAIVTVILMAMLVIIITVDGEAKDKRERNRVGFRIITLTNYVGLYQEDQYNIEKHIKEGHQVYVDPDGTGAYISKGNGVHYQVASVRLVADSRPEDLWRGVR